MRFLPDGADIPNDLVLAVLAGDVTFLCGAGLSVRAQMPLFKGLTEHVYAALGEMPANETSERTAFERGEYDRALRSLEKRTHPPGSPRSRVREEVGARLRAPDGVKFHDHRALLEISRDSAGRARLLTTNFDTLFERAASDSGIADAPSYAGKSLPKPGGPRDYGVLHLHGRIADPTLSLDGTNLVLTSADFGDAYLRDGWASRYIEDRMRLGALVLIGYRAEDAAFRLLLETLDADRDRFGDLKNIYAIEKGEADSASSWRAKGIKPIEFASFDAIYATLAEWAKLASRPAEYAGDRLQTILVKSPDGATEFEREQVRFFLGMGDLGATLGEINPPLSWMPVLVEWKQVSFDDRQIVGWIERNLADEQAVRDVVANIHLLGPDSAEFLSYRLPDRQPQLPSVLEQSWRLVIRHLRNTKRSPTSFEWLDLQPRIKQGDHSAEVLESLADVLRPTLTTGRRLSFREEKVSPAAHPKDLMWIEFKCVEDVSEREVLEAWPRDASAEADAKLLRYLAEALDAALAEALEIDIESNEGYGASDSDVPSVADHPQNEHRSGFFEITRVMAELWTRLAHKEADRAVQLLGRWRGSPFRLNHRLALYACTDPVVPADMAADALLGLPQGELFLTNTAVEVYRLIKTRWNEISPQKRLRIEQRLCDGPPRHWFREEAEIDRCIDQCRFDVLGQMEQADLPIGANARETMKQVRERWPDLALKPEERTGFGTWTGSRRGLIGDPTKLKNIPDDHLVSEGMRIDAAADFGEGNNWRALCATEPDRAFRGLEAEARSSRWPTEAWEPFFWECGTISEVEAGTRIARLLIDWPQEKFSEIAHQVSAWLKKNHEAVEHDKLWRLWDKLLATASNEEDAGADGHDLLNQGRNTPAVYLTEILLEKSRPQRRKKIVPCGVQERMDKLVVMQGQSGKLARARFAEDLPLLFDLVPEWAIEKVLPLFQRPSPEALTMWSARSFSPEIGGPELFKLMKGPFLDLFARSDTPPEQLWVFADWVTAIALANQSGSADYPLTMMEIRSALRRAGERVLQRVAHRLAREMEKANPDKKTGVWREVVGPVFEGIWPLDVELQTPTTTFKLVQVLLATGEAFPNAADVIVPFIRPERPKQHTTVHSIANADDILFTSSPTKMLDLLRAVVGDRSPGSVYGLQKALGRIQIAELKLADTREFQKLSRYAAP